MLGFIELGTATVAGVLGLATLIFWHQRRMSPQLETSGKRGEIAFLFDGPFIVDATRPARDLVRGKHDWQNELECLLDVLTPQFPTLRSALDELPELGEISVRGNNGTGNMVVADRVDDMTRIVIVTDGARSAAHVSAELAHQTAAEEIAVLRSMTDNTPQMMWQTDDQGAVVWANKAYMEMAERLDDRMEATWPPRNLFAQAEMRPDSGAKSRAALLPRYGTDPMWFEVVTQKLGARKLYSASNITEQVRAEDTQRDLQQTLTKTFAGLTIGMAVFDNNRQLALFNPALTELTALNPTDLITRPQMESFLDMLRENRILPEPKDYKSWRQKLTELEAAAEKGDFIETWPLYDGRSYRVTGRPFPNGAIALFIEDISNDVALAQRITANAKLAQDALDDLTAPVMVFGTDAKLAMANRAARDLVQNSPDTPLRGETLEQIGQKVAAQIGGGDDWARIALAMKRGMAVEDKAVLALSDDGQATQIAFRGAGQNGLMVKLTPVGESEASGLLA